MSNKLDVLTFLIELALNTEGMSFHKAMDRWKETARAIAIQISIIILSYKYIVMFKPLKSRHTKILAEWVNTLSQSQKILRAEMSHPVSPKPPTLRSY